MDWAASDLPDKERYKLLVNTVLPRPIALVTTVDEAGVVNAAPFSFFNLFSHEPPVVVLGIEGRAGSHARTGAERQGSGATPRHKDTWRNIRATGTFVVNLVDHALLEAMTVCGADFPPGESETMAAGLETVPSRQVEPPRIANSPVHLECRETVSLSLGTKDRALVVGEILHIHVRDGLVDERFHVDVDRLDLVARLHGADWYATTRDRLQVARVGLAGAPRAARPSSPSGDKP